MSPHHWTDYPQQAPYAGPETIPEAGTVLHNFSIDGSFQSALSAAQSNYLMALAAARQGYLAGQQAASDSYLQAAGAANSAHTEALQNAETQQQQQMLTAYDPNQQASILAGIDSLAASSAAPILQRIADLESIAVSAGRPMAASEPLPMGNSGAGSDFLLPGNFEGTDWSPSSGDDIQPPAGIPLSRDYLAEIQAEKEDLANDVGTAYYASTLSGNTGSVYDFLIQVKSDENDFDKAINTILKEMGEEVAHYNNETSKALAADCGRLRKVQSDAERLKAIAQADDAHWKEDVTIQASEQSRLAAAQAAEIHAKAMAQTDYDLRLELAREANDLRRAQMDAQINLSNDQIAAAQNALNVWAAANPGAVTDREQALFDAQADWIRDTSQKLSDWVDDVNNRLISSGATGSVETVAQADRADQSVDAYATFAEAQNVHWLDYSADLETASSDRRQAQSLAYTNYQVNPTPSTLAGGPTFDSSLHATSQSYEDLVSTASQNRQAAATIDEQAIYTGLVQPATLTWLTGTTAEDGIRRMAVMQSWLQHGRQTFEASRDYQAGLAPYSGPDPLPTLTLVARDAAFTAADDALELSHVTNDVDWRILTATHNQTFAAALAAAERDSLINAAIRDDVYARAIADADRKIQTWTHTVDVWYMGEVNDAEKIRQQSLALTQANWRDALYQANVDAWTAVDNDLALPWTDFRKDEAMEQQSAWLDRRGSVIGTTPDPAGGYRLKWLEMQSHVIQAEHDYQSTLIAAYDTMITGPTGAIEARHVQACADSASRLNSATVYAQDFYQFAVDSVAAESTWQIDSTFEEWEAAGGPAASGSQAAIDADYIAAIEGLQDGMALPV